jgi:hypothetical protein
VNIRPVDDRQDIETILAQAFERQMQGLIRPGEDRITRNSPSTLNPIYTDALPASFVTAPRITGRCASPPYLYTTAASPQKEATTCSVLLILGR